MELALGSFSVSKSRLHPSTFVISRYSISMQASNTGPFFFSQMRSLRFLLKHLIHIFKLEISCHRHHNFCAREWLFWNIFIYSIKASILWNNWLENSESEWIVRDDSTCMLSFTFSVVFQVFVFNYWNCETCLQSICVFFCNWSHDTWHFLLLIMLIKTKEKDGCNRWTQHLFRF